MRKNSRGRRVLAGLMLFTIVSSVVADCNLVTALAVDNSLIISESEAVLDKEDYDNSNLTESSSDSNQEKNPDILEENNSGVLEKDSHEDSPSSSATDSNQEEIPDSSKDNKDLEDNKNLEGNNDSEGVKEEDSKPIAEEESDDNKDFEKELIVDGYKIDIKAAEGVFPDGTKVEIETVETIGDEDAKDVISEEMEEIEPSAEIVKTVTFDITFYSKEGKIIEPENGSVSITIVPDLKETSELKEMENELGKSLECSVFHVDDELNVEEVECEITEDYTEVSFDAESFSSYVVTWYATPDKDGNQEISLEGPKYIDGFEKVPFAFSKFNVPISWTNDNGETDLRPEKLTFTIYGTDTKAIGTSNRVKICDVTLNDYNKTASNINLVNEVEIPVYVKKGTGKKESGGTATYDMEGFKYEVKFHYENTAYEAENSGFVSVKTDREVNEAIWYADAERITNKRKDLANASFKIEWYDNNDENHKRPYSTGDKTADENAIKSKVSLYYCTSEDSTLKPVTTDMMPAGEATTGPFLSKDSYSNWSISYKNLLPFDENGKEIIYKLKLADDFANEYTSDSKTNEYVNNGEKRTYFLFGNFKAKICWNDGDKDNELRPESALRFNVTTIKDGVSEQVEVAPEDIVITKNGSIWEFEVNNLVMYSDDGIVSYYVTLDAISDYGISYTNAPSSTDVEKCHNGGKIFLTFKRSLNSFTINKKWVDGGKTADREALIGKGVTLYLWRYPIKKIVNGNVVTGTVADGAPVNDANGEQYSYKLNKTNHNKDFELHFKDFVGEGGTLDVYDTKGYQYVYYVTEIMDGEEYVTSYSNVNPYTHIETAVANGGTLINLRRESIKIEGIVRWRVPSVTDYTKASATICLQKRDGETDNWNDVGNPVTLAGFTEADPQKKHVFPAVDKYDELGHEIEYRVIETNINYNSEDINVVNYKPVEGSKNKYVADDYKMNGYDYTATAHPTYEEGKYSFTVDNRMSGDVTLDITKVWNDKVAYGGSEGEEGHYSDISITIYQKDYSGKTETYGTVKVEKIDKKTGAIDGGNNKAYLTLTGASTSTPVPITVGDDTNPNLIWSFEGIELPEFDENGRAYTYSIKETGATNTHTSYDYKFEGNDIRATVTNTYVQGGDGEYIYFEIDKEWIDGADLSQRQPVTVAIVNVDPTTGAYSFEDNAGETHEYVLNAENNWHQDVWLSKYYKEGEDSKERFNKNTISGSDPESESYQWLWTVIEKDVSLKVEYEKLDDLDLSADDNMDVIHRKVIYSGDTLDLSATSINGTVDAIAHNDIHKPGYEVKIEAVPAGAEGTAPSVFGASKYRVINRRAGEVNITFDKTWHDSKNKANTRGKALRVYLYQNDKLVVNDESNVDSSHVYIENVVNPVEKQYSYNENGIGDKDEFKFENLPKYDDHGVAYEYSVREFMVREDEDGQEKEIEILTYDTEDTTRSGYVADIEGHGESVTFATNKEKLIRNELYKYNNTLTGKLTTGVPFYVIWHDQSSYDNGGRPDMFFTLYYRTIGSTADPVKFVGEYDVIWEASKETVNGVELSNPYYKKATFIGLPVADENGNAYEYFASASLNNAADHYNERHFHDHNDAKIQNGEDGTANIIANKDTGIHHYDIKKQASDECDKEDSKIIKLDGGNIRLLPAGGLIEYIIDEDITPKGKKFWKNVEQGITAADLPKVYVYLGRYSDHDQANRMYVEGAESSAVDFDKSLAYTSLDEDKLSFDFETNVTPTQSTGPTAPYDKYDYYGQIYTYQLAEKIYVNSTEPKKYQVPNYIMKYDPDSLNLVNTYLNGETTHVSSRSITVNKSWKDKDGQDLYLTGNYPEARFKLYRMEIDPEDCNPLSEESTDIPYNPTDAKYKDIATNFNSLKISGEFKECGEELKIKYGAESQPVSWDDMPIYAPSGRPYLYVVEETDSHGMSAYDITNDAGTAETGNKKINDAVVLISNYGLNPEGTYNAETSLNSKSVGFTNKLKNGDTISKITGEKFWTDNLTLFPDVRPNSVDCNTYSEGSTELSTNKPVELTLTRTARTQTGVNNTITQTLVEGKDYTVTWNAKDGSPNVWTYEITPINGTDGSETSEFQVYAPNGQPYTYTVTEKLNSFAADNYKATVASSSRQATYADGTTKILKETTTLSNTLKGQVQLFKKWDDALNELKLRSGFVHVILQYREVPSTDTEGDNSTVGWKTYKQQKEDGIYTLTYTDNKWKINVPNLPIKSSDGTKVYEYRVLEVNFNDHEATPLTPIIYDATNDTVSYKRDKNKEETISVPNGYSSNPSYKNSTRFEGTGHFETRVDNYIVNHSVIANLTKENTRMLQVDNFLSEKAALVIEKKWEGIEGTDKYEVLPDNIVFKIQYSTTPNDANSWKDLTEEGGNKVTATVSKEYGWKQSVDNLPLNTSGKITYYRAVELGTNLGRFEGYKGEGTVMSEKSTNPGVEHNHSSNYISEENRVDCITIATNTLATRNLTIKKKWNDDENSVHGDIDIELWSANYNTGIDGSETFAKVPGTEATLKSSEGYEITYNNLPLRNTEGKNIVYYVKEVNVDGATYSADKYDTAFFVSNNGSNYSKAPANSNAVNIAVVDVNGNIAKSVCIVNTPKATLNVTKKWNDENNRHQLRKNVIFKLTDDNGGSWTSITADATDNKTYYFENLPIYKASNANFVTNTSANMGKVTYTVAEDTSNVRNNGYKNPVYTVNGGTSTTEAPTLKLVPSADANNVIVLNEFNPPKATITADKVWDDENKRHGSRTSQVELSLYYRVGTTGKWNLITKKQLDEDGNYSDGGVYTISDVTQSLSKDEVASDNPNKWVHNANDGKFTTWEGLPTVDQNGNTISYKVLETSGEANATVSANYTGDFSGYEVAYSDPNGTTFTKNNESKNQIVTNKLKRTEILVEKDWGDTAEQKIRPYSVTFELEYKHANMPWKPYTEYIEENGELKEVVKQVEVTGDHVSKTWTKIVENLPFADCEGHEYEYRFKEVSIEISGKEIVKDLENDDSSFSNTTWKGGLGTYEDEVTIAKSTGTSYNYKVTAVNTPNVGSITVTKVWDDNNNRDGLRPNTIDVRLYRDGKVYDEKQIGLKEDGSSLDGTTVSSDKNEWTYTWTNLPMYKDNAGVHDEERMSSHYVVEEPISDDGVLSYERATYGNFRESITSTTASHIQSRVSDEDDRETDLWIKNTHNPIRFTIKAYKKWDDLNNSHNYRPDSINMIIQYYDSSSSEIDEETKWKNVGSVESVDKLDKTGNVVQTTSSNAQTISATDKDKNEEPDIWETPAVWENLPAYRIINGKSEVIKYRVVEQFVETHYEAERPHFSYDIEEAKKDKNYPSDPLYVENIADYNSTLTVIKEWSNKELLVKYGALPSELHVKLQKLNTSTNKWEDYKVNDVIQAADLKEHEASENGWTHTFQNLNKDDTYRVVEEYIKFKNGKIIYSSGITDNESDKGDGNGKGTIGNFNIKVDYKSHEAGSGDSESKRWEATLTNSIPNRKLEVAKKWNDENDRDKVRPTHIFVTLKRDGNVIETVKLDDSNNWKHTWDYLPLYKEELDEDELISSIYSLSEFEADAHGNLVSLNPQYEKVTYDITKPGKDKETIKGEGFNLEGVADANIASVLITNTHTPDKATVHAGKKWDDYSNKYGERAGSVTLALFYKYQHENDNQWRLIQKVLEEDLDSEGLYKTSLINTTSEPIQVLNGSGDYWKDYDHVYWKDLPSQAVVEEEVIIKGVKITERVIRIPEYRIVEINENIKNKLSLNNNNLKATVEACGGDITKVIRGYKTTQPNAFFVHDGVDNISFVNGGNDNENKDIIVVNKLETVSALITKKWEDQHNKFANRPISVNFAIQKKAGSKWEPLTENGKTVIVSVDSEKLGDDEDTWKLSVDGLPKCDVNGVDLRYRAVEVSLVYADKTVHVFDANDSSDSLETKFEDGHGYETKEELGTPIHYVDKDITEYPTTITNTQDSSVKVSAKKVWNDYNNGRKTRPLSVVFTIEKKPVQNNKVAEIIANIFDFFKENGGWMPVYELDGTGDKVVATITLDSPDFDEVSFEGLPLYDENGRELIYRAREIELVYENKTIEISSSSNPYQTPKYDDQAEILVPAVGGVTHSYTTEATNKIKLDPPKPPKDDPKPGDDPETPPDTPSGPVVPPVTPPKNPEKPELPPELEKIDEEIDEIKDPEDIVPIVDELIDLPDSPEKEYVVKKLWVVVSILSNDPTFYDHFDPEMQDILKRFVRTGVLGRRRGTLPKTGGLKGSFLIILMGFALIGIGNGFINKKKRKKQ